MDGRAELDLSELDVGVDESEPYRLAYEVLGERSDVVELYLLPWTLIQRRCGEVGRRDGPAIVSCHALRAGSEGLPIR